MVAAVDSILRPGPTQKVSEPERRWTGPIPEIAKMPPNPIKLMKVKSENPSPNRESENPRIRVSFRSTSTAALLTELPGAESARAGQPTTTTKGQGTRQKGQGARAGNGSGLVFRAWHQSTRRGIKSTSWDSSGHREVNFKIRDVEVQKKKGSVG